MGNTVNVNEDEFEVPSLEQKLAAAYRLETAAIDSGAGSPAKRLP